MPMTWNVSLDPQTPKYPATWFLVFTVAGVTRYIDICLGTVPWEVAVDAGLEFLDRLRTGAIPKAVDDPNELMSMCFRNARRQR